MYNFENKISFLETIDSTQKEMWRRLNNDDFSCEVIVAKKQLSGIGTHGRSWYSGNDNIIFSIGISFKIFDVQINKLDGITIDIAQILVNCFKSLYEINNIYIKNPNDLMIDGKKIGGILTETKLMGNSVKSICLGIGINTNQMNFECVDEIKNIATSIKIETGIHVNNLDVIKLFLKCFEENLNKRIGK